MVHGINAICERLAQSTFAKGRLEAQVIASQAAADIVKIQRDNGWVNQDILSNKDHQNFLEIFTYMLVLKGGERKGLVSLEFNPADTLHEFSKKN